MQKAIALLCLLAVPTTIIADDLEKGLADLTPKGKRQLPEIPDLTKDGKKNDRHDWNLGPTGARGWMWGMALRTDFARQILITKVDPGSPADGVLKVNDVIVGINGKKFESDARIAFGNAITEAEKKENHGTLKLLRWRDGKTKDVTLKLKVMGSYGPLSPTNCDKTARIMEDACRYIEKNGIGRDITGHVNALGLLASGDDKYLPMVRDYARSLKVKDAYSMSSWRMGYMNIFLSEYYLLTKDEEVLPKIREMALYLAGGQSLVGTWGHNNAREGGILLGYGAMCQPSLSCAVSLILNQKCGIDDPVVGEAIRKSEIFFSSFVNKGNIPYGDHSPREVHDSNGRSSLAVIFFDLLGNPEAYQFFARMTVASYSQREEGHTGNFWSYAWGPLGAMRAGPEAAAAFMEKQQWFYDLERQWNGGFTYQGGANMIGSEHTTPGWDTTGARLLTYAMSLRKLEITGRGLKLEKALTGQALADTMIAGEGYNVWHRNGLIKTDSFDSLPDEELLKRLNTWSMPMRIRAAKSLAKKPTNHVPTLMKMLDIMDREIILGGIYGLEYQGPKAEPAIDGLVALLTHEDEWIRFRAGCALCAIGEPAREKAVPVLLKSATTTMADDPREMNQRYVAFVLWGDGYNGSPRGLLRRDMKAVDQKLLIPAIRRLIRNQDGLVRNFVANGMNKMSFEQLAPLWDDIAWGVENASPSGIMFNAEIRETGMKLLAKYNFKETVPVTAKYVLSMKPHGSQARIFRIMEVLKSFGTEAKSALPSLYKARAYYQANLGPGKLLEFPTWATNEFFKGLNEGIAAIENATEGPKALRSFEDIETKEID